MASDETTDIKWLKKGLEDLKKEMNSGFKNINNRLDVYQENFETKEHAEKRRKKIREEITRLEKEKADRKTLERVESDLQSVEDLKNKIMWLVISIVITAVVYAVVIKPF